MFVGPPATSIKHIYHLTQMIDLNLKKFNRNVMVFNLDSANVLCCMNTAVGLEWKAF